MRSIFPPKKNYAVGFKTQRFDRFVATAAFTVHHHKHLQSFLDKYENVTNTLACIVRAFIDIPAIQVMATAVALIGHHLILPYLNLTHFDAVNYENLIPAAKQLDVDLEEANPDDILDLSKPAFKFVDDNRFKERNWPNEIIESLRSSVAEYHEEFSKLVMLMVADIKEGWRYQRGKIFGFGPQADQYDGTLMKNIETLNKAPISNMSAERHVGSINYELGAHGAVLPLASAAVVKSKSWDLIENGPINKFKEMKDVVRRPMH